MLTVYGSLMPLRLLEEIRFWKMQEKEHTVVIRELAPTLEPGYTALMSQWEGVFARTEAAAQQWIEALVRNPAALSPYVYGQINELLRVSMVQSREWIRHLFDIEAQSAPVQSNPIVKTVIEHIIRESEYFLGVLHAAALSEQESGPGLWRERGNVLEDHSSAAAPAERKEAYLHLVREDTKPDGAELTATQEGVWSQGIRPMPPQDKPVPIGGHKLPPLPYAYDALEPYIDAETMRLHHDKHHQSYVNGLNKAETMLARARETGDFSLVKHWEREAAFNGAGHYLHTVFWNIMKPGGGGKSTGAIAAELTRWFGSFEAFRKQFSAAAEQVEGGGWALLVWSPRSHRVEILQAEKHQNLSQWDVIPLLVLDVWEHAYYLKHKNERAPYIAAWWNTVNWDHVNERYAAARMLKWTAY
ncbi:DUF2935 domain-containing protein [Paenibacillus filicis]|uniref:superoxide dismutase n=1 Tax=Paenibacillus gyeongsangnamensis TaxID=3388067 RepID=A0ABT4QB77_9BACL|nr:Fe-Mn family superoxide dismutase [Paenibacillus filicis]MCZ8514142.1 DUF2935 domain-containing protein [Paenibacillus filicis]